MHGRTSNARHGRALVQIAAALIVAFVVQPTVAFGQTPAEAAQQLEYPFDSQPSGMYAIDSDYSFNVLDAVYYDAPSDTLSLEGHFDPHFSGHPTPYFQHLAALLAADDAKFSLDWTPESEAQVDSLLGREPTTDEVDKIAAAVGNMFDASGGVNAVGETMLSNLLLSPVADHRLPGYFGADVLAETGGAVRVSSVLPGSPAYDAGILPDDVIQSFNGNPTLYPSEFLRLARFSGDGSTVAINYTRGSQTHQTTAVLTADVNEAIWSDATRYDALTSILRYDGEGEMAKATYAMGVFNQLSQTSASGEALHQFLRALGAGELYDRLLASASGATMTVQERIDLGRSICERMDTVFKLDGHPTSQAYDAAVAGSNNPGSGISAGFNAFDSVFVKRVEIYLDPLFLRPEGVQVPAEVLDSIINVHPVMVPRYIGIASNTLLARAMFDGDYLAKRLTNSPQLKLKFPKYQTQYAFERTHPAFARTQGTFRLWISVAKMDVAQSPDHKTLVFRDARMQFNEREEDNNKVDLSSQEGGYDALLTSLFDDFERAYPTLHELREAAKLAAAVAWIRERTPGLRLPMQGMVQWNGPQTMPGLLYQYLSSPDASYLNARTTWIAEGGVSIVAADKPVVYVDPGVDAVPNILATNENTALSKVLHHEIHVPDPLVRVEQSQKGNRTLEIVSISLSKIASAKPECVAASRQLEDVAVLGRQLNLTERAIQVLSENSAERTASWGALNADLQAERQAYVKRAFSGFDDIGGEFRGQLKNAGHSWPNISRDTQADLTLFDRMHSIEDATKSDSGEEVSYGRATFNAIRAATKTWILESGNPVTGVYPLPYRLKPGVEAFDKAVLFRDILFNEAALAKLEFIEDVRADSLEQMQSQELASLKNKLLPLSKTLSDQIDEKLATVRSETEAGNCL